MSAHFGTFEPNGQLWSPDYGDIDWAGLQQRLVEQEELEPYRAIGFDSDDGLVIECTQENLVFRSSDVAPYMDMAAMNDPRDNKDYIWFREDNPERFANLMKNMGHAALSMHSRYPLPDTVAIYLDRRSTGISTDYLQEPQ